MFARSNYVGAPLSDQSTFSLTRLARRLTAKAAETRQATAESWGETREVPRHDAVPDAAKESGFLVRQPRVKLQDVILPETTRAAVRTLLDRVAYHSLLYRDWELARIDPSGACQAVNLHGLPGTGKTLCAEAIAAELEQPILEVNYAEIESKYVGETPKNLCLAFQQAAERRAVLFFDEADAILGRRLTNVTQAADQAVNLTRAVMLKQLDAFEGVVVFATNLARNFDTAFVRRILLHVEVQPPGRDERLALWRRMISTNVPGREELDWNRLADQSETLVGGDLKNAVILALASLAPRVGAGAALTTDDVLVAITTVRNGKLQVGASE